MSKASRSRRKDKRDRIKKARREARSALYKSYAEQGRAKQSKRARIQKKTGIRQRMLTRKNGGRNRSCGGNSTMSYRIFCRYLKRRQAQKRKCELSSVVKEGEHAPETVHL
jgi:hypothetical protein